MSVKENRVGNEYACFTMYSFLASWYDKRCVHSLTNTLFMYFLVQSLPDEVLDLGRSVRTLDLTHNRLGNDILPLQQTNVDF